MAKSPAEIFATEYSDDERRAFIAGLSDAAATALCSSWRDWFARPEQLAPSTDWRVWLLLAGRGFGKSRAANEWLRERVELGARRIAIVTRTAADYRDTVVEAPGSGLLDIFPAHQRPIWEPSKRRVTFHTGAIATCYSADKPDQIRGGNFDTALCDETASWRYPDAFDQLKFATRIEVGNLKPQIVVATTPRPTELIKKLAKDKRTAVTRGSTFENAANLSPDVLADLLDKYGGTLLGQQELYAAILDEAKGALWRRAYYQYITPDLLPTMRKIVVAVDPATTADGAEAGIVSMGLGENQLGYVLGDHTTCGSPGAWGKKAVDTYHEVGANCVVAEGNQGGEMVRNTIRSFDPNVPVKIVYARVGKAARAEPIVAKYEQKRIFHVGCFAELEDQCCTWDPNETTESPDRLDALVWAATELMLGGQAHNARAGKGLKAPSYWRGG